MSRSQARPTVATVWTAIKIGIFVLLMTPLAAHAQTFTVLHNFTDGADGGYVYAGVTFDQQARIYGTASRGADGDNGVVYRLVREGNGWVFSPIYTFRGHDGAHPYARVVFGQDGLLYGTTNQGGANRYGTVFSLQPSPTACKSALCPWVETVLYSFANGADGGFPEFGDLTFDQAGNIYGTASGGGILTNGVVFKLTRSGSGWTESVLWEFGNINNDGCTPISGVIFDNAGNLYGTTNGCGSNGLGTVYELSPTQSGWNETILHSFTQSDNGAGAGGLIMDAEGNLYGITSGSPGSAYELTQQNGSWSFTLLQSFPGNDLGFAMVAPTFDSQGNLYGPLTYDGSNEAGEIFKLMPSGNQWIYSLFYQFPSCANGCLPMGAVAFDANGNMYGTTIEGGTDGYGTVWEITP